MTAAFGLRQRAESRVLIAQMQEQDTPAQLVTPRLINLTPDPQEREPIALPHLHTWVATHVNRLIGEFEQSTTREPLIPVGASLDHTPSSAET